MPYESGPDHVHAADPDIDSAAASAPGAASACGLQYALWLLAALRLLVPVQIGSSALSALHLAQQVEQRVELAAAEMTATAEPAGETPDTNLPAAAPVSPVPGATPDQTAPDLPPAVAARDGGHWLQSVWLLGALAMAGWFLAVNLRFRRRAAAGAERLEADCPSRYMCRRRCPPPVWWVCCASGST